MAREPWIKVKIGIRRSGKLAGLPNDTARLGWFYVLVEAKTQHEMGVFGSLPHFREVMGRFHRFFNAYREAGLLEVEPDLCQECGTRYIGLKPGAIVVHDYLREQRSNMATEDEQPVTPGAKRTAMWRLRQAVFERDNWTCRYCGRADYERDWLIAEHVIPDGPTNLDNLVTACRGCNKRKGPRTPKQAGMRLLPVPSSPAGDALVTHHSDASPVESDASQQARGPERASAQASARGTTVTETGTTTEEVPLLESVDGPANGKRPVRVKGFHQAGDVAADLAEQSGDWTQALTLAERDEWSSFGSEWEAFRAAWLKRGFRHPPAGAPDDDPDAPNPSQRALLWSVLDARPNDVPRWIAEAPRRLSASQVVGHVIDRWHGKRDDADKRAEAQEAGDSDRDRWKGDPSISHMIEQLG